MIPTFAIIGRPNVGKSTLFNRLLRRGAAIAHGMAGVTRDRIYQEGRMDGRPFAVVDTGGLLMEGTGKDFEKEIFDQATEAVAASNFILFVVDGREGLNALDEQVAAYVRQSNKPVLLVVNKVDGEDKLNESLPEFHVLGFDMLPVSSAHGYNIKELRQRIVKFLDTMPAPEEEPEPKEKGLRLAMLGRPNAGKSSMINALIGENRMIVSEEAGTTRDSVDVSFDWKDKRYIFVDTAGVRRKANVRKSLERFSVMQALKTSKRADIAVLVVDGPNGLARQDKRLLEFLVNEHTPFIMAVNKVDLVPRRELFALKKEFERLMRICPHVPMVYTSTVTKAGLGSILPMAEKVHQECLIRIGTGQLNRAMNQVLERQQPPSIKGRRVKFYYMTQAKTLPPTFVFFVNNPDLIRASYAKYIENSLRRLFKIKYAPIVVYFRSSHGEK